MNRFIYFIAVTILLISACADKEKQLNNEKNILGDWIKIPSKDTLSDGGIIIEPDFSKTGFTFFEKGKFEMRPGFFRYPKSEDYVRLSKDFIPAQYLGSISKYIITADSLKIFDNSKNVWNKYFITKLNTDTLKIIRNGEIFTFIHLKTKGTQTPQFDKIILTTSACFGPCSILEIMISSDGTVVFNGKNHVTKKGLLLGKITKAEYNKLQNYFRKVDFDSLRNEYNADVTDQSTTTTTFVKGNTILKTVSDYGDEAPLEFVWAYSPLKYLYQHISLSPLKYPEHMSHIRSWLSFQKGNMIFGLKDSEKFLLQYYLSKGKISDTKFKPRFKMQAFSADDLKGEYDLLTDGRYYTILMNGKPTTIDIGFNFYDNNVKHWKWEKK